MTAAATGRELGMAPKSTAVEISVFCAVFIVLALWGVVWDISSGLLTSSIDGIMLLFVCAMMAGVFFLIMLYQLNQSGILPTPAFLRPAPKPAAAPKAPAPAAAPAAKAPAAATAPAAAPKPAAATPAAQSPAAPASSSAPSAPPPAPPPVPEK